MHYRRGEGEVLPTIVKYTKKVEESRMPSGNEQSVQRRTPQNHLQKSATARKKSKKKASPLPKQPPKPRAVASKQKKSAGNVDDGDSDLSLSDSDDDIGGTNNDVVPDADPSANNDDEMIQLSQQLRQSSKLQKKIISTKRPCVKIAAVKSVRRRGGFS